MAAGNAPDRIDHRQDCKAEGEGHAEKTDAEFRECRRQNGAAATTEDEPEGAEKLCEQTF